MFPERKSKWPAIALCGAIAIFCLVPVYYIGDLSRFQKVGAPRESRAPLRDLKDPAELEQLLKRYPSNGNLKLVALANKDAIELHAAALGLLKDVDPGELSTRINKGLAGRSDLELLGRDLKAAEDNAAGLGPRYDSIVKPLREATAHDAAALEGGADISAKFIAMIDAQHAEMKDLMARISATRLDYFKAYEKCVALLAGQSDGAKGGTGPIIFRSQAEADSYNAAASGTAAAGKPR